MTNLESWWELDGTDLENKASPGTHDLTDVNTVGTRTGVGGVGSAADFIAANEESYLFDRVEFADATDWTISYWVFHDVFDTTVFDGGHFSDDQTSGHYSYIYYDGATTSGSSHKGTIYGATQKRSYGFIGMVGGAAWNHYVWKNDDAEAYNLQLYMNGSKAIQVGGAPGSVFASNSSPAGYSAFGLRNIGREQAQGYWLDGGMQWFGMWSRKLEDAEIVELYNSGAGLGWPFGY